MWVDTYPTYKILVVKYERIRLLGRSTPKWKDNINTDIKVTGVKCVGWIEFTRDRVQWKACVNTIMNPLDCVRCGEFLGNSSYH
jgi:hypothetical protein